MAVTKTLTIAKPKLDASTNNVVEWDIQVQYVDESTDFLMVYSHTYVPADERQASEFTKSELINAMPANIETEIFPAHLEAMQTPPVKEKEASFDLNSLSD